VGNSLHPKRKKAMGNSFKQKNDTLKIEANIMLRYFPDGGNPGKIFFEEIDTGDKVSAEKLAELFDIDEVTIRRRVLKLLQGQGKVKKLFSVVRKSNRAKRPFAGGDYSQKQLEDIRKKKRKDKKRIPRQITECIVEDSIFYNRFTVDSSPKTLAASAKYTRGVCVLHFPYVLETYI
jgi:hypothetical protein